MKKIAIFLAVGFEEIEAISVIDILRRGGCNIDIISASGSEWVEGAHGIVVETDRLFYTVDYDAYDVLILPGGQPGTNNLFAHDGLRDLLIKFNKENKKLAAICAAPSVLGRLGILEGKEATCYPGFEDFLEGATVSELPVVKSENVITGKSAHYAPEFALKILGELKGKEIADKIKKALEARK